MDNYDDLRTTDAGDAFLWLLEQHDNGQSISESVLSDRFGDQVAAEALHRWREYRNAESHLRGAIHAGESISTHANGASKPQGHDPSLADTASVLATTKPQLLPSNGQVDLPRSLGKRTTPPLGNSISTRDDVRDTGRKSESLESSSSLVVESVSTDSGMPLSRRRLQR